MGELSDIPGCCWNKHYMVCRLWGPEQETSPCITVSTPDLSEQLACFIL
jgi:hypothetical protein